MHRTSALILYFASCAAASEGVLDDSGGDFDRAVGSLCNSKRAPLADQLHQLRLLLEPRIRLVKEREVDGWVDD